MIIKISQWSLMIKKYPMTSMRRPVIHWPPMCPMYDKTRTRSLKNDQVPVDSIWFHDIILYHIISHFTIWIYIHIISNCTSISHYIPWYPMIYSIISHVYAQVYPILCFFRPPNRQIPSSWGWQVRCEPKILWSSVREHSCRSWCLEINQLDPGHRGWKTSFPSQIGEFQGRTVYLPEGNTNQWLDGNC